MDALMIVVTVVSLIVAVTMSVIASRLVWDDRRRSDARVAVLAADISGGDVAPAPVYANVERVAARPDLPLRAETERTAAGLFEPPPSMPARVSLAAVVVLGALVLSAAGALAVVFAGTGTGSSTAAAARSDHAKSPASSGSLELVALGHERDGDGLTVRGVLRNPASGAEMHQLTAVVLLFNHEGGLVGTGRAAVHASTLEPGSETTFEVSIPSAAGVDRYRVSFRSDDHVVPHIDLRS